jgi:hypothetical protein
VHTKQDDFSDMSYQGHKVPRTTLSPSAMLSGSYVFTTQDKSIVAAAAVAVLVRTSRARTLGTKETETFIVASFSHGSTSQGPSDREWLQVEQKFREVAVPSFFRVSMDSTALMKSE